MTTSDPSLTSPAVAEHPAATALLTKVPAATALFWFTKILTTGVGETTSDWIGRSALVVPLGVLAGLALVLSMRAQLRSDRYRPWIYWSAVTMVSVFGTMAADVWRVALGVSYLVSTLAFVALVGGVLYAWWRSEGTLSIHSIATRRRERFYWATVLATFALGTATGDLFASSFHLGYWVPGVIFGVLILLPWLAHRRFGLGAVTAFWTAYVLTRPLGASFSDWAAVSPAHGGLGFGPGPVSLVLFVAIGLTLAIGHSRADRLERSDQDEV